MAHRPEPHSDRAISVEWQRLMEARGMMRPDAHARFEFQRSGKVLIMQNGGKIASLPYHLLNLTVPMEEFSEQFLAPMIEHLADP